MVDLVQIPPHLGHGVEAGGLNVEEMSTGPRSREGSPTSPISSMGVASMPEGQVPASPTGRSHNGRAGEREPPMGYHPAYGGPYHAPGPYPPPHGYGGYGPAGGAGGAQYPPAPHGYGYHPHMGPYPGYAPQAYGYGFGPGYPSQHAQPPRSSDTRSFPQEKRGQPARKSPSRKGAQYKLSPSPPRKYDSSSSNDPAPSTENPDKEEDLHDYSENNMPKVEPMRSDFHFFVDDFRDEFHKLAEAEVKRTSDKDDPLLIFTNLNMRLVTAWENATSEEREKYMAKEEEDRKRFMMDEEVASRHCATLTARAKPPRSSTKDKDKDHSRNKSHIKEEAGSEKMKEDVNGTNDDRSSEKMDKFGGPNQDGTKREAPPHVGSMESPTKKSRMSSDSTETSA